MRTLALIGIVLVWIAAYCRPVVSDDPIKLPMTPVLVEPDNTPVPSSEVISTLGMDQWYVIESIIELIALQSPEGIVDIEATSGPIKVRGTFVDGSGKIETRTYSSPYVYFVTAKTSGKTELILVPVGVTAQQDIVRQVLTVSGVGPQPPPIDPIEPVDPVDPTEPTKSFRVIFVKESGSTLSAEQTAIPGAKAIRDYLNAKTTPEAGGTGWREYDPQQTAVNETPTMKKLWDTVRPQIQSIPCMIIEVDGHATIKPLPENVDECLKILKEYGG